MKIQVIRDSLWEKCLADSVKMYRISEPNDACIHLANATWVMKKKYQEAAQKKDDRKIIFINGAISKVDIKYEDDTKVLMNNDLQSYNNVRETLFIQSYMRRLL